MCSFMWAIVTGMSGSAVANKGSLDRRSPDAKCVLVTILAVLAMPINSLEQEMVHPATYTHTHSLKLLSLQARPLA